MTDTQLRVSPADIRARYEAGTMSQESCILYLQQKAGMTAVEAEKWLTRKREQDGDYVVEMADDCQWGVRMAGQDADHYMSEHATRAEGFKAIGRYQAADKRRLERVTR